MFSSRNRQTRLNINYKANIILQLCVLLEYTYIENFSEDLHITAGALRLQIRVNIASIVIVLCSNCQVIKRILHPASDCDVIATSIGAFYEVLSINCDAKRCTKNKKAQHQRMSSLWWHISVSTCQIIKLTCQLFMSIFQIIMSTCQYK